MHNASFAGIGTTNFVGATYRTQWSQISGGPKTANLFGSFAMPTKKMGMGALVYSDKTGPTSRTGMSISFAKHINFGDDAVLSLGIENKFQQFRLDQEKIVAAIYRNSEHWKTNMALGGTAEPCKVTQEMEEMCIKAKNAVQGDIVGVDLMESEEKGLVVHEVNNTTEYKNTVRVCEVDIPALMLDYALKVEK